MKDWLRKAVFYQVYPSSFKDSNDDGYGDFNGITQKLEYIASIGCSGIWLNACFDSPFKDGGYDIRDYCKPSDRFGSMEDMLTMLEKAHRLGLKVLLDLVPGHTSDENAMFIRSCETENNEYSDRYIWTNDVWKTYTDYRLEYGKAQRNGAYLVNFFSMQPALNYGFFNISHAEWQKSYKNKECIDTANWLIKVIGFWLEKGFDGFRVDMADCLVKNDDDKIATIEVWRYIFEKIKKVYPEAIFLSEWSDPEKAFDAGFDLDFYLDHKDNGYHWLARRVVESENVSFFNPQGKGDAAAFIYDYLNKYIPTKNRGIIAFITGNHDIYRLAEFFDMKQLKLIYGTLLTLPGVPFIYYGDEIGLACTWKVLPKEGGFHRTSYRTPMQWNKGTNCGFSEAQRDKLFLPTDLGNSPVNVQDQEKDESSLLNFIKKIIDLRKGFDDFCENDFEVIYCESRKFPLIYKRKRFTIIINPTIYSQKIDILLKGNILLIEGEGIYFDNESLSVSPKTFAILFDDSKE